MSPTVIMAVVYSLLALSFLSLSDGSTPTPWPTRYPTSGPTSIPTIDATFFPTSFPTATNKPAIDPTGQPTNVPTAEPSSIPTGKPSPKPTYWGQPSYSPTPRPSVQSKPTFAPTFEPTFPPTDATDPPSPLPSSMPTGSPSSPPSMQPTGQPSGQPSTSPTTETPKPTMEPTFPPSPLPTGQPSGQPTSVPSGQPTTLPSGQPTAAPSYTHKPTLVTPWPTYAPSPPPTSRPSVSFYPTKRPSGQPTGQPSMQPTSLPTTQPSGQPTSAPSNPTSIPTQLPISSEPTPYPWAGQPSEQPTPIPTYAPTDNTQPTLAPTDAWVHDSTDKPTSMPSGVPSGVPSPRPTPQMTTPTGQPTTQPSGQPTTDPTAWEGRDTAFTSTPTSVYSRDSVTGTVSFHPTDVKVCEDVEVSITVTAAWQLYSQTAYKITTPGLHFNCSAPASHTGNDTVFGGVAMMASWPFEVEFYEGNAYTTYVDSYLIATYRGQDTLPFGETYTLVLDRANGLKKGCPDNSTWSVYRYTLTPNYLPNQAFPTAAPTPHQTSFHPTEAPVVMTDTSSTFYPTSMPTGPVYAADELKNGSWEYGLVGNLNFQNAYLSQMCFTYSSSLSFFPALPQFDTTINLTITLGFTIRSGDNIKIALPGFTSQKVFTKVNPGRVYHHNNTQVWIKEDYLTTTLSNVTEGDIFQTGLHFINDAEAWTGTWNEGDNSTGYRDSYLRVYAGKTYPAGSALSIIIDKCPNGLMSLWGYEDNYPGFNFVVTGGVYYTNITHPDTVDAIGDNCKAFDYCSGNGRCNYNTSSCTCFDGYGSSWDHLQAVSDDFKPDCSSKTCPTGAAIGTLGKYNNGTGNGMHRTIECSANGVCNRDNGVCRCFEGFDGRACERMKCPTGIGGKICSGRGVCKPMHRLVYDDRALPLSNAAFGTVEYSSEKLNGTKSSWDSHLGSACVCDSAWSVGLDSGETQLAEFFGPACELRRCPSGDDPITTIVTETNCQGVSQTGGSDTGASGNLCHIDCSNQGTCNFETGECTCFPSYYGHDCGSRRTDVSAQVYSRKVLDL